MSDLEKNKLNDEELLSVSGGTSHETRQLMHAMHEYELVPDEMVLTDQLVCDYLQNCFHIHATLKSGNSNKNVYTQHGERISHRRVLDIIKNNGPD